MNDHPGDIVPSPASETLRPLKRVAYIFAAVFLVLALNVPCKATSDQEPSIRAIEKKLSVREHELAELKRRLSKNRLELKRYQGRRLNLKVRILKLRVQLASFHLQVSRLQIREIQDRRAIKRLENALAHLDVVVSADILQKGALESRLLLRKAEQALANLDGTDIQADAILRTSVLSDQTHHLDSLLRQYKHKQDRLKVSRDQLQSIQNHEKNLLRQREAEETRLKKKMVGIQAEIVRLKKREESISQDNQTILKRRRELMGLILRLERLREKKHLKEIYRNPPILGKTVFRWPVAGMIVEKYGPFHDGIDIAAPVGSKVRAAWTGKVLFAKSYSGYGRLVILSHGKHLYTLYGHLNHIFAREGQRVAIGEIIGTVGRGGTQGKSTLFFGVTRRGKPLSPMRFLRQGHQE